MAFLSLPFGKVQPGVIPIRRPTDLIKVSEHSKMAPCRSNISSARSVFARAFLQREVCHESEGLQNRGAVIRSGGRAYPRSCQRPYEETNRKRNQQTSAEDETGGVLVHQTLNSTGGMADTLVYRVFM